MSVFVLFLCLVAGILSASDESSNFTRWKWWILWDSASFTSQFTGWVFWRQKGTTKKIFFSSTLKFKCNTCAGWPPYFGTFSEKQRHWGAKLSKKNWIKTFWELFFWYQYFFDSTKNLFRREETEIVGKQKSIVIPHVVDQRKVLTQKKLRQNFFMEMFFWNSQTQ